MKYESPLVPVAFVKREKRFFLHGTREAGAVIAHCANTGSLKSILDVPVRRVWLAEKDGTGKLKYGAEVVELESGALVSINTHRTNLLAGEAIANGRIAELMGHTGLRREAKWDAETRFDFHLTDAAGTPTWVEVKSVTLRHRDGAQFPDAVSTRGQKHLATLMRAVERGERAVQLYIVARDDCPTFCPADHIDAAYGRLLRQAHGSGVEVLAYGVEFHRDEAGRPAGLAVARALPVSL
jgi:sugar fermentation stimulation protein A